jgi:hypothetical protein
MTKALGTRVVADEWVEELTKLFCMSVFCQCHCHKCIQILQGFQGVSFEVVWTVRAVSGLSGLPRASRTLRLSLTLSLTDM